MCGIVGIFGKGIEDSAESLIDVMNSTLVHRGPDDSGIWKDLNNNIIFGHRRLAVLDLSKAGHQPMESKCGRYVICFNGEIYNHISLRSQLGLDKGWLGNSDTETMVTAFSFWGIKKTIEKLVGMFALAVWDKREKKLYLIRDRIGEKPLYYGWSKGKFIFGSELKAIKSLKGFNNAIDRDSLGLYLRHCYIPSPRTIYKDIYKLSPGCILEVQLGNTFSKPSKTVTLPFSEGSFHINQYWSYKNVVQKGRANLIKDEKVALSYLEESLRESIRLQSIADVPLGAFLSGGIDSSLIVSLMQSESISPVHTYTIGFEDAGFNEAIHAKKVAEHLNTNHTELYVSADDALSVVPLLSTLYDEPFGDSSQIPTYLVSKMAKEHVTVALSGDAGDELFGGYNRHVNAPFLWKIISLIPKGLRPQISTLMNLTPDVFLNSFGNSLPGKYKTPFLAQKLSRFSERLETIEEADDLYYNLVSEWKKPSEVLLNYEEPHSLLRDRSSWPKLDSFEDRMMYLDIMTYLPDDILVKVDRAAMAVSLETRAPFLDHRVIELSSRIPLKQKIHNGKGKQVLRKLLYQFVPKELIERPKQGFGVPLSDWLRGPLKGWSEELLEETKLEKEGFFNPKVIRGRWESHLKGKTNWEHSLWNVLMFQSWFESQ